MQHPVQSGAVTGSLLIFSLACVVATKYGCYDTGLGFVTGLGKLAESCQQFTY